jgi:ABC-type nitrate/sulfonate/bicarbonate transport system substrate-binding protein
MGTTTLRIGFVPLIDAAPVIAAQERGFFAEEGLRVTLHRQVGWANVRDKLSFGHLDAAHALLGMPLASHLGRDSFSEPLVSVMGLGSGGNAITVRRELYELGVKSAADLARVIKENPRLGRPMVGHVFGSSMHHYLVREWLASGGLDPDRDVQLCVIPPPQMTEHMKGGYLDVFCVGEPWNTVATRLESGVTLLATTDILPRHPEKVLALSRRFAEANGGLGGSTMTALVRAVLRGCMWCAEMVASMPGTPDGGPLTELLARPEYLAQPREVVRESLLLDRDFGANRIQRNNRPAAWVVRSFSPEMGGGTFPNKMHAVWMMREMIRWGHLHPEADVAAIAEACCDTTAYRAAATTLGVGCPAADFVPMELRNGRTFGPLDVKSPRSPARLATSPAAREWGGPGMRRRGTQAGEPENATTPGVAEDSLDPATIL